MSSKVFISKNYREKYTASSKAKLDGERIAEHSGYKNIGLPAKSIQNQVIGRLYTWLSNFLAFMKMPRNGIVFLQYPVMFSESQVKRAKKRGNKVCVLIHDLNCLRSKDLDTVAPLRNADVIIAHTPAMKKWLLSNGINDNVEVLKIFDYLDNIPSKRPEGTRYKVAFAGNLGKSKFINKLHGGINLSYRLFGVGADSITLNDGVEFCGCFSPDELSSHLDSHFGLVWDGDTLDGCSGINGEYLTFISPHKLSMYLTAGLPVIVWKKSAMCDFVRDNGVGITIDSLNELPELLSNLTTEDYERICKNVASVSDKIGNGEYLTEILNRLS